jgi:phosphatidylglycerophosphate synthase
MFDAVLRRRLDAPLARVAVRLDRAWITPDRLTLAGLALGQGSPAGGFLDITADFLVYGATVVGVAIGTAPTSPSWTWLPFAAVLLAYYVNGTAFLAFSSIAERTGPRLDDGRSLSFLGGVAEGAETILVHSLWLLLPLHAPLIASVWAGVVGISALHRVVVGYRTLRGPTTVEP